jgi:hypothetical protein
LRRTARATSPKVCRPRSRMSVCGTETDRIPTMQSESACDVRFSNRPVWVKRMYLAPTTTSVRLAIFRRAGIAGPRSSTTWTASSNKLACTAAARSTIAVMSKRSVARTTERPTFTPPWKNSNRNSRQQTINHEHLQERFVVCATTFGQTKHGRYNNPEKTFCGNRSRPLRYVKGLIEQLQNTGLRNVCWMAIAKTQQEYTLAQTR